MFKITNQPFLWKRLPSVSLGATRLVSSGQHLEKSHNTPAEGGELPSVDVKKIDEFTDIETHTGQKFDQNDYRLSRFIGGKVKKVNTRFAIDLVAEIPPKAVKGRIVACDGGGGPLGHPKVFINLDQPGNHCCGYCGLRFYQEHSDHH